MNRPYFYPQSESCQISNLSMVYEAHLGCKFDGFFVDVGAHDGYSWSNTWGLSMLGWAGIMFEPLPALYGQLSRLYKGDTKIVCSPLAVTNFVGKTKLYLAGKSLPTTDRETAERSPWGYVYHVEDYLEVDCVTLDSYFTEHQVGKIDVLSIDVEGGEPDVLRGVDLRKWQPTLLIVETHEGHPEAKRTYHVGITDELVLGTGIYTKIQHDGINTVYLNNGA